MKKNVLLSTAALMLSASAAHADPASLSGLIAQYAAAHGVPETLVHRVVRRESNYNPRAVGRGGALGLMQIKHATARGMGYAGSASGLLDANTNLAFAVPYLAGAYRVAGGNHDRAVSYYASGYYYAAKRQGLVAARTARRSAPVRYVAAADVQTTGSVFPAAQPAAPVWIDVR
jgi:soluble lytic murein transglycosylase-like protein